MKQILTLIFTVLFLSTSANTNVKMTFGYFDCYTGYKVQPITITAEQFSANGQIETTIAVNTTNKNISLPSGKYLLTINCNGYKKQVASIAVADDNAIVYEFFLSPFTKDYRTETEYVQSKVQSNKMFINGFVVDENGRPISNATLTISNKQENVKTNSEGYFEILFPLQSNEDYLNFEISKKGFTKNVYKNVLCWNKGDWTYQVKLRQGKPNTTNIIESTTASPHIETPDQLFNSLPNIGNANQPQSLTSGSCVPNSINVAFSSTGTNCCPGGGGGFPSCQTVQNYIVDVYVEHVIPNEWLASWNALPNMIEAFKAGAVAIRSYSTNKINHPVYSSWYDICSSPCCQNFGATNSITTAGVTQTTDWVLYYNSDVPLSEYSAENNHLLPQCTSSSLGIFCTDGQFSLLGTCYSDPVSIGKRINGHGRGMSQRGSARWASGYSLGSCSNSTSGLPSTGLPIKNWTQILNQYYPPYTVYYCGNSCSQPANDLCGNAISLTPASSCSYTDGTTCGATPINPTTGMPTCVLSPSSAADVWYKFVATNANATVSVQSAANFDAVVQVLSNVTCASSYTQMQCVNNTGAGGLETVSLTGLTVSNTYWIRIVCNTGSTGTDFQVCVTSTVTQNCPDPYEPNDAIASAYNLFPSGLGSSSASTSANGYVTTGADQDWFLLNISTYGTLNINLTNLSANYDLALYTGSGQLLASSINTGTTSENISYSYTSSSGVTPPFYIKIYPNNSNQFSVCSSYNLSVSWTPSSNCTTPNTPTPNSGTSSCPGAGYTTSTLYLGYNINGASNYDIVIEEYPYGSSNIVYTQNCVVGNYSQIASSNIVSGKMYRYYVRATTDCNTCNSAYSQPNYFHIVPEIFPSPSIYVCNGTGVTLSTPAITVPSGGSVSYQWYQGLNSNSTLVSGATGNTCYVTQSGYYYVKAVFTGSSVCSGSLVSDQSMYTYFNVATTPSAPVLSTNSPVCEGSNLTLSATAASNSQYFWTGPNGFSSNNNSLYFPTVSLSIAGSYDCYVINSGCQSPTATINISVTPAPIANFTYLIVGNTVTFTNNSTNATSYNWTFGDSQTSTQTNPSHTYSTNNNFNVCLTANSSGCNSASNCQLVSLGGGSSGSTVSTFAKLFNDTDTNHKYWTCYDIIQSSVDSGYIGVGWYQSPIPSSNNTIQYFKLDKNGNIVWVRSIPEYSNANILKIVKSQNGYLLSLNYNQSTVMEIDEQGNKLWAKSFNSQFEKFSKVNSGGYVGAGGSTNGFNFIKVDNVGSLVWQKQFTYSLYTSTSIYLRNILQDASNNFYLYGFIGDGQASPPFASWDGIIIKIDANGNHLWTKFYASGTSIEDQITSAAVDNNSDIVFAGFSRSNNILTGFIGKANSSGTVLTSKQLPSNYSVNVFNATGTNYDCLVYGSPNNTIGIATLNSSFSITNQKEFDFKSVYSAKPTFDNKFIVCGQYPYNTGNTDYRYNIFKVSYTDNSCIDTIASSFSLNNFTLSLSALSPTTSTPSITISNFVINPTVSALTDTSLCHQCNLAASVTPSGPTSFCSGGSVTLTANPGMTSYLWSNGQSGQSITVSQTGNYSVAVTDNYSCPATSQNVPVTVNTLPYADAGIDQTVCSGSSAVIGTSQIVGNTYSWTPTTNLNNSQIAMPIANPTSQITYSVTVSNSFNCTASDQTIISVNSLPTVTANATASSICTGGSITLTGSGATTYTWTNGVIDGVPFTPSATATYIVTGTGANGCQDTATQSIAVNPLPTVTANASSTSICPGESVTLTGGGASTYSWNNGVTNAVAFSPITTNSYIVTGTDIANCQNIAATTIIVNSLPAIPTFQANGNNLACNTSTGVSYQWNFNGVPQTNDTLQFLTAASTGYYSVTITDVLTSCSSTSSPTYVLVNGIESNSLDNLVSVYPNPTNDLLNITGIGLPNNKYTISLSNVLGQLLLFDNITIVDNRIEKQINLKQFSSGIYFLKIESLKSRLVFKINKL